ncbi:MAG TPA: hypothetical protein DCF33_16045 [Saprospirales bacterium]|nr:hypothetical protein [Saprospirales bacterium]
MIQINPPYDFNQPRIGAPNPNFVTNLKTMQIRAFLYFLAILALIGGNGGCSPFSKIYTEEEPGVNLSKYHTFNWLNNPEVKDGNSGPLWLSAGVQGKIRTSVEAQMSRYGFKPCDDKPDLMLHYHIVIKNEILYVRDWSCGGVFETPGNYDRCNRVQPVHYREGTLIIDFIDSRTGNQVWRGAAVGVLDNMKPEEADLRVHQAVEAIFRKFPEKPLPPLQS